MDRVIKALKRHWILFAIFAIIIVLGGAYIAGYRPGPGLTLARTGTLELTKVPAGAQVFIDYGLRGTGNGGDFSADLMPGNHTVIVNLQNSEPWEKIVTIASNKTLVADPLLIPKIVPTSTVIGVGTSSPKVPPQTPPSVAAPLILGCSSISVQNNQVVANIATSTPGCSANPPSYLCSSNVCGETIVYSPVETINNVIAYPGRTDTVLVSTYNNVFVVGLDPRTPQTFAVVLDDQDVRMMAEGTTSVRISNGSGNFRLTF